jgi:acetyl esterase/lipase
MKKLIFGVVACLMMIPACTTENPQTPETPEEEYNRELKYTYTKAEDGIDMEVYLPTEETNIKVAVIACPGGSYSSHASHEGAVWAPYFNELGVAFAVLKYTLPAGDPSKPIGDMETALTILNEMADKWLIDKNKIGVMGFSAGGHLACFAATASEYSSEIRPDFQILVYPVTTMSTGTHAGSRTNFLGADASNEEMMLYSNELWVSSDTPKAFITYAKSETVVPPASNGKAFYNAMIKAGAKAELLELVGTKHGWHHGNAEHETAYLQPMKARLTPWLQKL